MDLGHNPKFPLPHSHQQVRDQQLPEVYVTNSQSGKSATLGEEMSLSPLIGSGFLL
jgi:hypothetical protein